MFSQVNTVPTSLIPKLTPHVLQMHSLRPSISHQNNPLHNMRVGPMMVHPITSVGNAQASAHDGDVAMETSAEVWLRLDQCAAHLPQNFFRVRLQILPRL